MALANGLLIANVSHARQRPKRNAFSYHVYYLSFALSQMSQLANRFLSLNKFGLFSYCEKDHPVDIQKVLKEWDVAQADGEVVLVTMPRVLGHVFNPVSFWFCLDKEGALRAVLSEVRNTFGDSHNYISFHDDRRPIGQDDLLVAQKIFHVSPFMEIKGHYQFRFIYRPEKIGVWIDYYDEEGLLLTTSLVGKRSTLSAGSLLLSFFRYPLVTLKVVGLIHFQAVRLWLHGNKYIPRPAPPSTETSK